MLETGEEYFECPKCGWFLTFHFDEKKNKYISVCSYCGEELEMEKEEYENNEEIYFENE